MKSILIIDDDVDLLEVVGLIVEANQMKATCVASSGDLYSILQSTPFDLILMDVYLGNDDGRELARQLKQDEHYRHIPIILYSAGTVTPLSIEQSLANDFLQKPFEMPVLIDRMQRMLSA